MMKISALVLTLCVTRMTSNAFVCQPRNVHRSPSSSSASSSSLEASYDPYSSSSGDHDFQRKDNHNNNNYKSRTDVRQFLTQRSIQSFVFLLNQCKEGATVRWLEKQLEFNKIDSFHGTGAFNTTLFPEWDSFFMQLVVQNQESIIIEVEAQKKSHRGWAHRGNYLDGLGNKGGASSSSGNEIPSSASSSSSTSQASSSSKGPQGGLGNYLNQLGSASTSATSDSTKDSSSSSSAPKMKPKWQPASKATTKSGSYLDSLNSPKTPNDDKTSEPKLTAKKDQVSAAPPSSSEEPTITMKTSSSESLPQVPKPKTTGMRGGSYLDGLSSNTIESTNQDDTTSSQSNKIIENPHFEPKTVEFQFDVDPGALVTRMLSVREQIAREWKDDLATLVRTNERILDEYEEQQRVLEAAAAAEDEEEEDDDDDDDNDGKSPVVEIRDYLKDMASPYRASQEDGKTVTYDRSAMVYLTNSIASQGQAASPFRRSNFDLLLLLCTQESIHRVLMEYKNDSDDEMHMDKFNLLNTFYKTNVEKYFDGHEHSFGRGDQFLEAFLKEPRIGRTTQKGNLSVIDPVAIMEDLLRERSRVAREWKSIINMIPDEHLGLRRLLFNRHLMESSNWDTSGYGTFVTHVEESASIHSVPEPGAFE